MDDREYAGRVQALRIDVCVSTANLRKTEKELQSTREMRAKLKSVIDKRETLMKMKIAISTGSK